MPRVGFEPTISADERPKTYALDHAATGTGNTQNYSYNFSTLVMVRISVAHTKGEQMMRVKIFGLKKEEVRRS